MTAPLPYQRLIKVPTGQLPSAGQGLTPGHPGQCPQRGDVGYTAAGTPVFVYNREPWATLYLLTVEHDGERRHTWVYGSPWRLVETVNRIGLRWSLDLRAELDGTLPPVERG